MADNLRILVVDDDPYLLDLLIETLASIGYDAVGATNGDEALAELRKSVFGLVITDIKMPGINGLELAKIIKNDYPRLPVILITGVFSADILNNSDADGLLTKPFRIGHMEELIARTISSERLSGSDSSGKVLVVDDDDGFRLMLSETLKLSGYSVIAASDAGQALSRIRKGNVSTVITDIKMPGMDGISLARHIKNHFPHIRVILVTAFLSPENQFEENNDADGFLMKPFRVESITDLLENLKDAGAKARL
ncbi:MAG: response regulator [FCB group bacterium]|nr:response regulator [FCB group bacterium]